MPPQSTDPVALYQQALAVLQDAARQAAALVETIARVKESLNKWRDVNPDDPTLLTGRPRPAALKTALKNYQQALAAARKNYNDLSPERQVGLKKVRAVVDDALQLAGTEALFEED